MDIFAEAEKIMWDKPVKEPRESLNDAELNEKYRAGEHRINRIICRFVHFISVVTAGINKDNLS
jgi:hypothetical protein